MCGSAIQDGTAAPLGGERVLVMMGVPLVPVDQIRRVVAGSATSKACKAVLQHRQEDGTSQDGHSPHCMGIAIMVHGAGLAAARAPGTGVTVGSRHRS